MLWLLGSLLNFAILGFQYFVEGLGRWIFVLKTLAKGFKFVRGFWQRWVDSKKEGRQRQQSIVINV